MARLGRASGARRGLEASSRRIANESRTPGYQDHARSHARCGAQERMKAVMTAPLEYGGLGIQLCSPYGQPKKTHVRVTGWLLLRQPGLVGTPDRAAGDAMGDPSRHQVRDRGRRRLAGAAAIRQRTGRLKTLFFRLLLEFKWSAAVGAIRGPIRRRGRARQSRAPASKIMLIRDDIKGRHAPAWLPTTLVVPLRKHLIRRTPLPPGLVDRAPGTQRRPLDRLGPGPSAPPGAGLPLDREVSGRTGVAARTLAAGLELRHACAMGINRSITEAP